jgi:alkyldihydroxyacetonephosphate synthase
MSEIPFKKARQHLLNILETDIASYQPFSNPIHLESDYPPAVTNEEFCNQLKSSNIEFSLDFNDRFHRCRGQAMKDFYILRNGKFERIPDIVVFPKSHEDVVLCVELANKFCAVIIPYAGGTNTMLSLSHSKDDRRFFISLDVTQMNRILWIDRKSMLACMEAGIVGRDMEEALDKEGLTVGHEPDSIELSTLGEMLHVKR